MSILKAMRFNSSASSSSGRTFKDDGAEVETVRQVVITDRRDGDVQLHRVDAGQMPSYAAVKDAGDKVDELAAS